MSGPVKPDVECKFFRDLPESALKPGKIHRFIAGQDTGALKVLTPAEAKAELGDPFATLLLLEGVFPKNSRQVFAGLEKATGKNDPLRTRRFFFLGEGSQVPPQVTGVRRNLRFLAVTGSSDPALGPDLMISTFHPDRGDLELMAWDRKTGGFNYYRTVGDTTGWVFAGNSRHAVEPGTEGNGPFQTHTSGNFIMKELKAPWINWHSPDASISPAVLPPGFRDHEWFLQLTDGGALTCELEVARPSITRWTKARFNKLLPGGNGTIDRPRRIMEQILTTPTVNLVSSLTPGTEVAGTAQIGLPETFFVDSEALAGPDLGLEAPPGFSVPGKLYAQTLKTFKVRWTDGDKFTRPGDTHFAFVVPERAFEDQEVLRRALKTGLIGDRLAASLLMVDFPNPIYSEKRAKLLGYAPASATVKDGKSTFGREMVKNILAAVETSKPGSAEREFAERWNAGTGWKTAFNKLLTRYYRALEKTLKTQSGVDGIFRVAESRRNQMSNETPLDENPLLFATTNIPRTKRASLRHDGKVAG